jgi:hypothetical protein
MKVVNETQSEIQKLSLQVQDKKALLMHERDENPQGNAATPSPMQIQPY